MKENEDHKYIPILRSYFRKHKRLPSFEGVCDLLGFGSTWSVTKLYKRLIKRGYLVKQWRSFTLQEKFLAHKVYESVKAGFPSPWDEENSHNIDIDTYLLSHPESTIMIKVSGDSMIEAGIHTGDIVIVDKGMNAKVDHIVVAEVDREFTLKYLKKDNKGYYLHAGNSKYPDFHPREELKIFGVVVGVIRKYQK